MKVKVKLHDRSDVMNFIEKYVLNKYGIQVVDMFNGDITMRDAVFIYELSSSFITNLLNKSQAKIERSIDKYLYNTLITASAQISEDYNNCHRIYC